jgi:hypothetical protein
MVVILKDHRPIVKRHVTVRQLVTTLITKYRSAIIIITGRK